jgi:hypothetical protein
MHSGKRKLHDSGMAGRERPGRDLQGAGSGFHFSGRHGIAPSFFENIHNIQIMP